MVELKRKDWEDCKNQAEQLVRAGMIMIEVNENLLKIAEEKLKKMPKEDVKKPLGL